MTSMWDKTVFRRYVEFNECSQAVRREVESLQIVTNSQEGNWNNQGYGDIDANENMKSIVVNGDFRAFFAAIPFLQ